MLPNEVTTKCDNPLQSSDSENQIDTILKDIKKNTLNKDVKT